MCVCFSFYKVAGGHDVLRTAAAITSPLEFGSAPFCWLPTTAHLYLIFHIFSLMVRMAHLCNYHSNAALLKESNSAALCTDLTMHGFNPYCKKAFSYCIMKEYCHTASFRRMSQGTLQQTSFRSLTGKSVIYNSCESGPAFW